jgi:uncharacterized membrane protein YheB (UPF0754 family)
MQTMLFILFSVAIAALIGGLTNYLAIKMLFHPRREIRLAGRKLPFTPGLIPKRKDEIAVSLGKVVADHLVTSQSLVAALNKPDIRERIENGLRGAIERLTSQEDTVERTLAQWFGDDRVAQGKAALADWLRRMTERGFERWWDRWSELRPAQLIPEWEQGRKEQLVRFAADVLIDSLREQLRSEHGSRLIRRMIAQLIEQGGGFLGSLAGWFMDEDKMAQKVRTALLLQLGSAEVRQAIEHWIRKKLEDAETLTVSQWLDKLAPDGGKHWAARKLDEIVRWADWLDKAGAVRVADALGPYRDRLAAFVPHAAEWLLGWLQRHMDRIVRAVELPAIVENEVRRFPVERLEQVVLSVSGREFRAITWLGALLGGVIGLMQASATLLWKFGP